MEGVPQHPCVAGDALVAKTEVFVPCSEPEGDNVSAAGLSRLKAHLQTPSSKQRHGSATVRNLPS